MLKASFFLSVMTVIFLGVQSYLMEKQLNEMETASEQAKKTLNLLVVDQRPWVSVDMQIVSPLVFSANNEGRISVRFILKNTGRSPATNIEIFPKIYLLGGNPATQEPNPMEEQSSYCGKLRKHIDPNERSMSMFGYTLFPGDTLTSHIYSISISANDYLSFFNKAFNMKETTAWIHPILIGCVNYGLPFNDEHHQTGFIRKLIHLTPSEPNGGTDGFTAMKGSVPLKDLLLYRSPWGDGSIN